MAVGAGEVADAGALTVGAYFDEWLAGHLPSLKPSTAKSYREVVQWYVKPRLGRVKLVDLNALLIRSLYAELLANGGRRRRAVPPVRMDDHAESRSRIAWRDRGIDTPRHRCVLEEIHSAPLQSAAWANRVVLAG